jgi:hypothetical protein
LNPRTTFEATMAENNKHQQLVNSLSEATVSGVKPSIDAVKASIEALKADIEAMKAQHAAEFANLCALISAVCARFEVVEYQLSSTPGGTKRTPRGERKTRGASAAAAKTDNSDGSTVKNSMLFARDQWAKNPAFRTKYWSKAVQAKIDSDSNTCKHAEGSEARLFAEGRLFWSKCATPQQKKDIRDEFNRWKEERERSALAEPLGSDDGADDEEEEEEDA